MKICLSTIPLFLVLSVSCRTDSTLKDDSSDIVPPEFGAPVNIDGLPPVLKLTGVGDGNSGVGWKCRENGKTVIYTLDLKEALATGKEILPPKVNDSKLTAEQKLAIGFLSRIATLDPYRYKLYRDYINNFFKDAKLEKNLSFPDSIDIVIPFLKHTRF